MKVISLIFIFGVAHANDSFNNQVKTPVVHAPTINIEKTPPTPLRTPKPKLPVLLDARASFDYAMGHLPQALSIRWQDYSQTQEPHRGALDPDLNLLARKLRFLGISPDTKEVIVLGLGAKGGGEEGRIAWMLSYLGLSRVKIENIINVPGRKTTDNLFQNESANPWNPKAQIDLRTKKSDVEKIVQEKPVNKILIDVRTSNDSKKQIPGSVHIQWTEFVSDQGEAAPLEKIKKVLEDHKVDSQKTLIFYSDDGVASGYATFVLFKAGLHTSNYDGSFQEWAGDPHAPTEVAP